MKNSQILIWGKTYPQLSWKHRETVCTGGCDEQGRPVRIYPVPLRYLPDGSQYKLWDWISVPLDGDTEDTRPESYKVLSREIAKVRSVGTSQGAWTARREIIFKDRSWHYSCVRDLERARESSNTSLGFIKVGAVDAVRLERRSDGDRLKHESKLAELKSQTDLFGLDQKDLEFFPYHVRVHWRCERLDGPRACPGHKTLILDWGLGELGRREGPDKALSRMEDVCDLTQYDLRFFMGNFKAFPHRFGVVGLWYPKKKYLQQLDLLTP